MFLAARYCESPKQKEKLQSIPRGIRGRDARRHAGKERGGGRLPLPQCVCGKRRAACRAAFLFQSRPDGQHHPARASRGDPPRAVRMQEYDQTKPDRLEPGLAPKGQR